MCLRIKTSERLLRKRKESHIYHECGKILASENKLCSLELISCLNINDKAHHCAFFLEPSVIYSLLVSKCSSQHLLMNHPYEERPSSKKKKAELQFCNCNLYILDTKRKDGTF
jgi:hypothetical protein